MPKGTIISPELKNQIWESMNDVTLDARYWEHEAEKYYKRDHGVRILLAIFSVLTTAEVAIKLFAANIHDIILLISALITACFAVIGLESKIKMSTIIANQLNEIAEDYGIMWRKIKLKKQINYEDQHFQLLDKIKAVALKIEPTYSIDIKLRDRVQEEVIKNMKAKGWMKNG